MPTEWIQHLYADWVFEYGKDEADKILAEWQEIIDARARRVATHK